MEIEILITATIKEMPEDDLKLLKIEIRDAINEHLHKFTGRGHNPQTMWPYFKDVDHEVCFDDEGRFEFEPAIKTIMPKTNAFLKRMTKIEHPPGIEKITMI